MNLFQRTKGRDRPELCRAARITARPDRLYNIRYSMTPRGPRRDLVEVHTRPLLASWSRNPVTGALECRWRATSSHAALPEGLSQPLRNIISMHRRGLHADMRPPSR
ncbi:hypothetical protein [Dyella sp. 20L07]|uniref:hypothetical protein n=1 Tax=Dyella sp. 20L07 TaxID=3384240 RepID=UPI003D275E73